MPSSTPCLGCGFELDADGYLVRIGEQDKTQIIRDLSVGGWKYCDPTTQRSWDVPFHMPWGLMDEAVQTISTTIPVGPPATGFWQMPGLGAFTPANSLYAPFRRVRLEGWVEVAVIGGSAMNLNVSANGVSPPNLSDQLCDQPSFGYSIPISVGLCGPSLGVWNTWWTTTQPSSGAYVQFRLGAYTAVSAGAVAKIALSIIDDGPGRGVFYSEEQRFWPSTLPYP